MQRRFVPVMVSFTLLCALFYALTALAQEESAPPVNRRIQVPLLVEIGLPGTEPMSVTLPITFTIDLGPLLQGSEPLTGGVNVTVRIPVTDTVTEGEIQEPVAPQEPLTPTAALTQAVAITQAVTITPTIVITPSIPTAGETPISNGNTNLRAGPGTEFAVVGGTAPNVELDLVARNGEGDWYQLSNGAWIAAFLVDNAPEDLPLAVEIPVPPQPVTTTLAVTPTAELTSTNTVTNTAAVTGTLDTEALILVPTPTAGVVNAPVANANAFLRGGPGTGFPIVGNTVAGTALLLVARNGDSNWFQLRNGDWIAAFLVDNAPVDLPVAAEIPVPLAPTPTPAGTAP